MPTVRLRAVCSSAPAGIASSAMPSFFSEIRAAARLAGRAYVTPDDVARMAAERQGTEPPEWPQQPVPEGTTLGPPLGPTNP